MIRLLDVFRPVYLLFDAHYSKVDGGSYIHVNIRWSQKLLYRDHKFCLNVPFTFPAYVVPVVTGNPMKEKLLLNVNSGTETDIICNISSHPIKVCTLFKFLFSIILYIRSVDFSSCILLLKETRRQAGELGFSYEADVQKWSTRDLCFSYSVRPFIYLLICIKRSKNVKLCIDNRQFFSGVQE